MVSTFGSSTPEINNFFNGKLTNWHDLIVKPMHRTTKTTTSALGKKG